MINIQTESPSFYKNFHDFEDAVESEMKNPEKTTLNHILNKEKSSGSMVMYNKEFKIVRPKSILRSTLGSNALYAKKKPTYIGQSTLIPPKVLMPDPKQIQKELLRGVHDPHSTKPIDPEAYLASFSKNKFNLLNPTQGFYRPQTAPFLSPFGIDGFSPSSPIRNPQSAALGGLVSPPGTELPSVGRATFRPFMKNYRPYNYNPVQTAYGSSKAEQSLQKLFHSFDKDQRFGLHCQKYMPSYRPYGY
jgi:hypothetical protein